MINEFTNYKICLEFNMNIDNYCIVIRDAFTGKILSFQQYDEWIQYVGGNPQ